MGGLVARASVLAMLTSTDIVADVQGYFRDGAFYDVADRRLFDTRAG